MEFKSFKTIVRSEVERRAGKNYRVRLNDVVKNNGVVLSGLTVTRDDSNISPTIYLDTYYKAYENGQTTLGTVIDDVMDVYERNKVNRSIDMCQFLNFDAVKHRIVYKLINSEKNEELLKDVPHIEFHDLSLVFQFLIAEENFHNATILIHNAHLKIWNVSIDELYKRAQYNTPVLNPYEIKNMEDVIGELMAAEDSQRLGCERSDKLPVYVLSNQCRIFGAACMLYPDLIKDFSEAVGSDLFIIPSSVHEVLLLPAEGKEELKDIKYMVKEVNDTQVELEEVLSYSVYFFDREEGRIDML